MANTIPHTPFSTPLSGSARETEMRLKNIFSGPKRRPPFLFLALMFAVCLLCGNLVSCQMAEAEGPELPDAPEEDLAVPLDTGLLQYNEHTLDDPFLDLTPEEVTLLTQNLPVSELPRAAVDIYGAHRRDYWRDMLLPVAADEEHDITVYFVTAPGTMPDLEPGACPDLRSLSPAGVVLRYGDRAAWFPLLWELNAKSGANPTLLVDDLDEDGKPEAALILGACSGTGAYVEDLYLFDLDTLTYTLPDYSQVPLEITYYQGGTRAWITSGDREWPVQLDRLGSPFPGRVDVGNVVSYRVEDGQLLCRLDLDFACNTLGYLAFAEFPVVFADGVYKLGPAATLGDVL